MGKIAFGVLLLLIAVNAAAATRNREVPRQFQKLHPCPSTGLAHGPCHGWVRDHLVPLCAGGADRISNMQWQRAAEARVKDRAEHTLCRRLARR